MNAMTRAMVVAVAVGGVSGCTFPSKLPVYKPGQVGQIMSVERGEVIAVRDVVIEGNTDTRIGRIGGGVLGGAAAVEAGGDPTGRALAGAGAAIGGMVVGNAVEEAITRKKAQEVTVRMRTGEVIAIIRETGKDPLFAGDHVNVMSAPNGQSATLTRL